MHERGRLGWRAEAMNTYRICAFLHSLDLTTRNLVQAYSKGRVPRPGMMSFEEMFGLPARAAAETDGFSAWTGALDRIVDDENDP